MIDRQRLYLAYLTARDDLLAERVGRGHWIGELSSSALSTATAASALALVLRRAGAAAPRQDELGRLVAGGVRWLADRQNPDGGWGDTDKSLSNIATTMLAVAAIHLAGEAEGHRAVLDRALGYVASQGGIEGIRRRYGRDKTFSVPILTNAALGGLVEWREVAPLPFELACMPQAVWGALRLPVVSYAIPALVAIGQARHASLPPRNPITRWLRQRAVPKSLAVVARMQPASGGFLEATPLTSFVVMSLAGVGRHDHPVVERGVEFLVQSVRRDGSWPIDTNLATWTTTLSLNALAAAGEDVAGLVSLDWLLSCQHRQAHPMTGAAPGGWGWTDLSGAVPDADDTSGALLALAAMRPLTWGEDRRRVDDSVALGLEWLLRLQNRNGGWPTFCRGWGRLPFDRSGVDLTAHALRALYAWRELPAVATGAEKLQARCRSALGRGLHYLASQQREEGSWVPLWFGNQYHPEEENPIYGTARALLAYRDLGLMWKEPARRGLEWLAGQCDSEGGWGRWLASPDRPSGVSSVEETAVAVEALLGAEEAPSLQGVLDKGVEWLVRAVESGQHRESQPIGLYFARLWYYERLYPLAMSVSALGRAVRRWMPQPEPRPPATPPEPADPAA